MVIIGLAGFGVETDQGTKRESKAPKRGQFIGSPVVRIIQTRNASDSLVRASVSTPFGLPSFGRFLSSPCHGGECMAPMQLEHGHSRYGSGESAINVRAITQPLARDKQTCPARGMRNSSAMPDSWLDVTRCHHPRITRRQAQRTGPPIALTRQGV